MSLPFNDPSLFECLIHQAADMGISMFDTADLYDCGENEIRLGAALRGRRQQVMIATKVGNRWRSDGSGWDWYPHKEYILRAADDSLRRLGTDHIDLYQLHGGTIDDPFDEILEAFEILINAGKISAYGISSIRPNVIRKHLEMGKPASVMVQYSLADRRPEETILPILDTKGIRVLARGVVGKGLLCGKSPTAYLNHTVAAMEEAASVIRAFSGPGRSPVQTTIRFVTHRYHNVTPVIGISKPAQVEELANTMNTPKLTDAEYERMTAILATANYEEHR